VPYRDFTFGTAIGMWPEIAAVAFLGGRAIEVWKHPTPANIGLAIVGIVLWIAVLFGLQRAMNRARK
jgi:uncharacterized membrane protein YdjX (TVP38/TMEM64 family)